jgi:hypothetical protein
MNWIASALPASALLASCADPVAAELRKTEATEAMFRNVIAQHATGFARAVDVTCFGVGKLNKLTDPNPTLIRKLQKLVRQAMPASRCRLDDLSGRVREVSSGKPAIIYFVDLISCYSTRCRMEAGYLIGNLGAAGTIYNVYRKNGKWVVSRDPNAPQWIS